MESGESIKRKQILDKIRMCTTELGMRYKVEYCLKTLLVLVAVAPWKAFEEFGTREAIQKFQKDTRTKELCDFATLFLKKLHFRKVDRQDTGWKNEELNQVSLESDSSSESDSDESSDSDMDEAVTKPGNEQNSKPIAKVSSNPPVTQSPLGSPSLSNSTGVKTSISDKVKSLSGYHPLSNVVRKHPPKPQAMLNTPIDQFRMKTEPRKPYCGKSKNSDDPKEMLFREITVKDYVAPEHYSYNYLKDVLKDLSYEKLSHFVGNNARFETEADELFQFFVVQEFKEKSLNIPDNLSWHNYYKQLKQLGMKYREKIRMESEQDWRKSNTSTSNPTLQNAPKLNSNPKHHVPSCPSQQQFARLKNNSSFTDVVAVSSSRTISENIKRAPASTSNIQPMSNLVSNVHKKQQFMTKNDKHLPTKIDYSFSRVNSLHSTKLPESRKRSANGEGSSNAPHLGSIPSNNDAQKKNNYSSISVPYGRITKPETIRAPINPVTNTAKKHKSIHASPLITKLNGKPLPSTNGNRVVPTLVNTTSRSQMPIFKKRFAPYEPRALPIVTKKADDQSSPSGDLRSSCKTYTESQAPSSQIVSKTGTQSTINMGNTDRKEIQRSPANIWSDVLHQQKAEVDRKRREKELAAEKDSAISSLRGYYSNAIFRSAHHQSRPPKKQNMEYTPRLDSNGNPIPSLMSLVFQPDGSVRNSTSNY